MNTTLPTRIPVIPAPLGDVVCVITRPAPDSPHDLEIFANSDDHLHLPGQRCAAQYWLADEAAEADSA